MEEAQTPIEKVKAQIRNEAAEAEKECIIRSRGHFLAARRWDHVNLFLGIPATLLAGVTSLSAFTQHLSGDPKVTGVLAILVAALTALTTFLNPNEKANLHKSASSTYDELRIKLSLLKDIDLSVNQSQLDEPTKENIKHLRDLADQFVTLGHNSPRIPGKIYVQQKTLINEKPQ